MTCGQNPGGKSVGRSYGRSNDKYPPSMCRYISNRFNNQIFIKESSSNNASLPYFFSECKTSRDCYNNRTVNAICTDGFCMGNQEVKNLECRIYLLVL